MSWKVEGPHLSVYCQTIGHFSDNRPEDDEEFRSLVGAWVNVVKSIDAWLQLPRIQELDAYYHLQECFEDWFAWTIHTPYYDDMSKFQASEDDVENFIEDCHEALNTFYALCDYYLILIH